MIEIFTTTIKKKKLWKMVLKDFYQQSWTNVEMTVEHFQRYLKWCEKHFSISAISKIDVKCILK